ncbi:MAG: hypothetical protein N2690_03270, partial [Rhodocyclaceae bacterium]|nr:hypothetical protein [Rhodocyclaceae bacterium]
LLLDASLGLPLNAASELRPGIDLAASPSLPARFHARAEDALADGTPLAGDAARGHRRQEQRAGITPPRPR